jgi:hypothetical protein
VGKKLNQAKPLFVVVEEAEHERLRTFAFERHRSQGDVVRQALKEFLDRQEKAQGGMGEPPGGDTLGVEQTPRTKGRQRRLRS